MPKTCKIDGCEDDRLATGMCETHYQATYRARRKRRAKVDEDKYAKRFFSYLDTSGKCWLWTGSLDPHGFGQAYNGKRNIRAHLYAYELAYGPRPKGVRIIQTCNNRKCCHPHHLKPLSYKECYRRKFILVASATTPDEAKKEAA